MAVAIVTAFPGARWWKVDFHTHSPASSDYGKGAVDQASQRRISPSDWLLGFMKAEIDAVVITDHNSGEWVDKLKSALDELEQNRPQDYRPLVLFPGVEITANGGAHILCIFQPDAATSDISKILGAVGVQSKFGESDRAATKSPIEVVQAIIAADAIPIVAHVDAENSAFSASGNTLAPLLDLRGLNAMEVCQHDWVPPEIYRQRHLAWSRVLGSDSHHPAGTSGQRYPGSHFTWVRMEKPSHEGIRLALLDGNDVSIRRSDLVADDQNQYSHLVLEEITVTDAQYCGRGSPLSAQLSPWLTTIIGGRGTGKSTIIQLLRLALRREDELPEMLKRDFESFRAQVTARGMKGALLASTKVQIVFRKDGLRFRVQWSASGGLPEIEEERAGIWSAAVGDIRTRFPVRIFSQGQIFEMASDGRALLKIIDEAPEVGRAAWKVEWEREEQHFLSLRLEIRGLERQLTERSSLEGRLSDVCRKLEVFEDASHADVLKSYQRSQRQQREVESWKVGLDELETILRNASVSIDAKTFTADSFDVELAAERPVLDQVAAKRASVLALVARTSALADEAHVIAESLMASDSVTMWAREAKEIGLRYEALVAELAARGVPDVSQYGALVQERRDLEERLKTLEILVVTLDEVKRDAAKVLQELYGLRKKITEKRSEFLSNVLSDNPHVRMSIDAYGHDARVAEVSLRSALGVKDGKFEEDILSEDGKKGRLAELHNALPSEPAQRAVELELRLQQCKSALSDVAAGTEIGSAWFKKHLRQLSPEALDRLQLWFPADELVVSYSPRGDGRGFRSLEQGSPGQKTAAILAFLLAHGMEPIVLDQPEDDLDNELIYQLIVSQLRANKRRRQVLVVTHNPNIVVNGDSELILVMESAAGQCRLNHCGSLQSRKIREQVCNVMEGGRAALEKRYRRILVGDENA